MAELQVENQAGLAAGAEGPVRSGPAWAEVALLTLLASSAFLVRLWPLWQVHFWDETVYLQNAEVICCGRTHYSELNSRPPLLSLLFAGVYLLWHHVYAASLVTALLNALGPLLLYWAGKKLYGRTAGAIAGCLLAFSPFFVKWGNSLLTDQPAVTLMLLSFCLVLKGAPASRPALAALAGCVCALSGLMRFPSLILAALLPLFSLAPVRRIGNVLWFALGVLAGFAPYLLWSRMRFGAFFATLRLGMINVGGSVEPRLYYFQKFGEIFPWLTLAGVVLWFAAWVLDRRQRHTAPAWAWEAILWWWILLVMAYYSSIPHKELRYIMPLATPVLLLAGRGLGVLLRGRAWYTRAVGGCLLATWMAYSFAPTLQRFQSPFWEPFVSEEKEVADDLKSNATRPALLYANHNSPVFAYYSELPTQVVLEQDMAFYQVFPRNMPADGYLIVYKQTALHPRPVWADVNPHFRLWREYPSLFVYEYRKTEAAQ